MATLEHEQLLPGARPRPREHHVFVSRDGRRQRVLRAAGLVAGALALVWLVALGLAMAGSTRLPGFPVPGAKRVAFARDASPAATTAPRRQSRAAVRTAASTPRRVEPQRSSVRANPGRTTAPATVTTTAVRPAPAAPAAPAVTVTAAAPPAQTPATPRQGWARRGSAAPPGQTRRNQPAAPAGHATDSTGTTTSTTHGNGHGKG